MTKKNVAGEPVFITSDDRELFKDEVNAFERTLFSQLNIADIFPPELAAIVNSRAEALPCDPVAFVLPILCAVAGLVGKRSCVHVKTGWSEPLVVYGANVMSPSSLKSQIAADAFAPLKAMEAEIQAAHRKAAEAASAAGKEEPLNTARRFQVQGTTHSALVQLLCRPTTVGLLSYHDELSSLFAEMELSHNSEMRAEWLSLWNGGDISSDRSGVHRFAEATGMSSFGNVQPDRLAELMAPDKAGSASGDGLWCRYLFCRPKELPYRFNEIEADLSAYLTPLFERIDAMPTTDFKLSKEAKFAGARLWESLSVDSQGVNAAEAAFLGKLRGYSVRLAGILHILCLAVAGEDPSSHTIIPAERIHRASILVDYFRQQWKQVHVELGHAVLPNRVTRIIKKVNEGCKRVTTRDALRWKILGDRKNGTDVEAFFRELVDKWGIGRIEYTDRGSYVWLAPVEDVSEESLASVTANVSNGNASQALSPLSPV